eukprot:gnl/Trimastix_PCT/1777.p2 GENE.gnl/Trimastix_PCT/1777~~gnl/Trimastix_PCT/1777.p2  ORF type:complete len:246 (+),score=24.91 gnl/Trimastix_PCT/1777:120-857(+)
MSEPLRCPNCDKLATHRCVVCGELCSVCAKTTHAVYGPALRRGHLTALINDLPTHMLVTFPDGLQKKEPLSQWMIADIFSACYHPGPNTKVTIPFGRSAFRHIEHIKAQLEDFLRTKQLSGGETIQMRVEQTETHPTDWTERLGPILKGLGIGLGVGVGVAVVAICIVCLPCVTAPAIAAAHPVACALGALGAGAVGGGVIGAACGACRANWSYTTGNLSLQYTVLETDDHQQQFVQFQLVPTRA